jgi:transposase
LDAIFYAVVRGGCAWRLLPHEFPPWQTIYHYFRTTWRLDGTWERINRASCASASARWRVAKRCAQRGDHGQSVGEDHGERRRSRLRRCQEDKRPQTPPFGRYRRTGDEGKKSAYPADTSLIERAQGWCWIESMNLSRVLGTCGRMPDTPRSGPKEVDHRGLGALSLSLSLSLGIVHSADLGGYGSATMWNPNPYRRVLR